MALVGQIQLVNLRGRRIFHQVLVPELDPAVGVDRATDRLGRD